MNTEMQTRRELELDFRKALAQREFRLFFQSMVDTSSRQVTCFETLLRWPSSRRGPVLPGEFVPLAEEIGLIIPLGAWVLFTACAEATKWPSNIKVAVNLSPVQFRDPNLFRTVKSALAASGLAAHRLELEITESTLMQDSEAAINTLRRLRELGITIAMDDFGTGYSSLSYLNRFPFDKIKIDQCFVRDSGTKAEAVAIVRSVVQLGRVLGIPMTAEGVETEEQFEQMRLEGCAECQGFLFSRPCPPEDLLPLIDESRRRHHARAEAMPTLSEPPRASAQRMLPVD